MDDYEYMYIDGDKPRRRLSTLKWTTEPPTVEGWYWAMHEDKPFCVYVRPYFFEDKFGGIVNVPGHDKASSFKDFTHWLGPLPIPAPPANEIEIPAERLAKL